MCCEIDYKPKGPDKRRLPFCVECGKRHVSDPDDEICDGCWGRMLAESHLRRLQKAATADSSNTADQPTPGENQ